MQIVGVHHCSLVELDLREVTFEQSFQLQVGLLPAVNKTTAPLCYNTGELRTQHRESLFTTNRINI